MGSLFDGRTHPYLDPAARGMLVGLTASHTRAHVIRAILEGVAFSLRDTFTIFEEIGVPVKTIRLGGGGARSALWRQIQADVYGQEVETWRQRKARLMGPPSWRSRRKVVANSGCRLCGSGACCLSHGSECQDSLVMNHAYSSYRRIYPTMKVDPELRTEVWKNHLGVN